MFTLLHWLHYWDAIRVEQKRPFHQCFIIARTHTHWEITCFPMRWMLPTWGPGNRRPQSEWFLGPQWLLGWKLCDFINGVCSWFYPMIHGNEGHRVLGNYIFPDIFLHWFWHWSLDKYLFSIVFSILITIRLCQMSLVSLGEHQLIWACYWLLG